MTHRSSSAAPNCRRSQIEDAIRPRLSGRLPVTTISAATADVTAGRLR
jgi:hypothetical protein